MKRSALVGILALSLSIPVTSHAATSVGINVNIGDAPPPPVVVFRSAPRMVMVPNSTVYVVDDNAVGYDVFRYGVYWYAFDDGYWYRARTYRGPFAFVQARYVPTAIVNVPPRWWRHPHGGPPGQWKDRNYAARDRDDHDRGHGHGHGWKD
jgi:hypothetical protein